MSNELLFFDKRKVVDQPDNKTKGLRKGGEKKKKTFFRESSLITTGFYIETDQIRNPTPEPDSTVHDPPKSFIKASELQVAGGTRYIDMRHNQSNSTLEN